MNTHIRCVALFAALIALQGCFSSGSGREAKLWTVECPVPSPVAAAPKAGEGTPRQTVRLGQVSVASPWDGDCIMVRRPDGSLARDPYNKFAAAPTVLLKGPVMALAAGEGSFGRIMPPVTSASPDAILEVNVSDLSLDCTGARREASVALSAALVSGSGRKVIAEGEGSAKADATSGDYSASFSEAFSAAAKAAFSKMK